jgi:L-cystine transport system substrate-binding protein
LKLKKLVNINKIKKYRGNKMKRLILVISVIIIIASLLAGCSSNSNTTTTNTTTSAASTTQPVKVTTVQVAVANDFNPYAYLDANGNYIGYEIDVLKDVDALLPQYQFNYQTESDQFVALTSNKVDLIAHEWESNPERQATYLFGNQLVTTWAAHIVFKDGRTDIQTISDLEGKNVMTFQGSNDAYFLETYNKTHNNAIKLTYVSSTDVTVLLTAIQTGTADAFILPLRIVQQLEDGYNVKLGTSAEPVYNSNTYFIYRKNDASETTLQQAVDGALKTLTDNGTLKALSIQWLGADYVDPVAIETTPGS